MTTNESDYQIVINGYFLNPINPNEIKGTIVKDDIESRLNLEKIMAKEYLDVIKTHHEMKRKSILPYIDLESKDEKGHLYFLPLEAIYEYLDFTIPYSIRNRNNGWIIREEDLNKPIKWQVIFPDGKTIEV